MPILIGLFALLISFNTAHAQQAIPAEKPSSSVQKEVAGGVLTAAAIAALIVKESRQQYYATGHPCACPDDHMRNGNSCGNVSAYIRPGGAHPLCYPADVTAGMIEDYRVERLKGAAR